MQLLCTLQELTFPLVTQKRMHAYLPVKAGGAAMVSMYIWLPEAQVKQV